MEAFTTDQESTSTSDRRKFLKKFAAILAVGIGVVAAPAQGAGKRPSAIACCPNYQQCFTKIDCGSDHTRYLYCEVLQCCVCGPPSGGCQYIGGVPC